MFTLSSSVIADKLIGAAVTHGGGTISAQAYGKVPATGYVVSYDGGIELDRLFFHNDSAEHRALCEFIERNLSTVVFNPLHYFGSWQHNGVTYVNVSRVFSERATAVEFGRMNHQLAGYDLGQRAEFRIAPRVSLDKAAAEPSYHGRHRAEDHVSTGRIDYVHRARRSVVDTSNALDAAMAPAKAGVDYSSPYILAL